MFAAQPVLAAAPQLQRMAQVIRAVEPVVALPAYCEQALADERTTVQKTRPDPGWER